MDLRIYNNLSYILRSESQYTCDCLQQSGAGVLLLKPHPDFNTSSPSEVHFTPNPPPSQCEFLIQRMTVVSESKHLELYIDDIYEMTAKGCAVSLKKGRYSIDQKFWKSQPVSYHWIFFQSIYMVPLLEYNSPCQHMSNCHCYSISCYFITLHQERGQCNWTL